MKNNNDPIKQENKKALPKFILIMAAGIIAGVILGLSMVLLDIGSLTDALTYAGLFFTARVSPWLLAALPVVELAACLPGYFKAKKQMAGWDGEDETVSNEAEGRLSVCMWVTGMVNVLNFFLAAAIFSGFISHAGTEWDMGPVRFFGGLAAFMVTLYVTVVLQQKLVDATKRLRPEKHGSVYDTKFQKKWMDSCDEAEQAVIGRCAVKAYQAVTLTCVILWGVLSLGGMFFSWGFMPSMAVCIVWGVSQSVYCYWAIKLSKPGAPSAM